MTFYYRPHWHNGMIEHDWETTTSISEALLKASSGIFTEAQFKALCETGLA